MEPITGYGAVFYDGTERTEFVLGEERGVKFVERIMPGTFDRAIRDDDVVGLFNHDDNNVLGRTSSGTMRLSVDQRGLRYEIDPPDTELGRSVAELQKRGDVSGSSFAFLVTDHEIRSDGNIRIREVRDVKLIDVGPVTYPAYKGTNQRSGRRFIDSTCMAIPVVGSEAQEIRSAMAAYRTEEDDSESERVRIMRLLAELA